MNKLIITHGSDFIPNQQWIRFDIRSDETSQNRWAALTVNNDNDMIPYQSFAADKEMEISRIGAVIDLLNSYLAIIQREKNE